VVPAAMSSSMAATSISGKSVLPLPIVAGVAYIASPISRLISVEVVEALRPALRERSNVTVMRIKAIVDMTVKAPRAVKPRARSKKYPANKPIRPVVAVRSTIVRGIVEVSVRAHRSRSDVYADRNLSLRDRCRVQETAYENGENKRTDFEHDLSLHPPGVFTLGS